MIQTNRLHPAAIAVWWLDDARRFLLALLAVVIARGGNALVIVSAGAVVLTLFEVLRYLRFTYRIEGNTLIVEGGLLNRFRRSLPFVRIQSVDVVQKLRHRVFRVVELRIETAGGSSTEAPLVALKPEDAERLRPMLLGDDDATTTADPRPPALVMLTLGDLIVAALTGGRVAVVAVIFGYAQEVLGDELLESLASRAEEALRSALLVTVLAILGVVALVLTASVIATTLVYWNFTVRRQGPRLIVERGLLERRRATVPLKRVQAVQVRENPLRRIFRKAALTSITAGYSPSNEEREETSMLLPIGSRDQALWLAGLALDLPAPPDRPLGGAPRGALLRRLVEALLFAAVVATVALVLLGPRGLWSLLLLLPLAGMAWLSYRALGFRLESDYLAVQSGVLNRRTTIIPRANVQHLALSRGPVQRAFDLASLRIGVPKAKPHAHDLARSTADATMTELYGTS
ncbi:PH domain-containing protein [soil metagenome]